MGNLDVKERILDAAETLFACQGFHATSMRNLTVSAGVSLAMVNYYFGSKEALFDEVFEGHLSSLTKVCRRNLNVVRDDAHRERRQLNVDEILYAIIEPILCCRESRSGSMGFPTLLGRAMISPVTVIEKRHVEPFFFLLLESLREAQPNLAEETLLWRVRFAFGAIGSAMCGSEEEQSAFGRGDSSCDAYARLRMLMTFVVAGMEANFCCWSQAK